MVKWVDMKYNQMCQRCTGWLDKELEHHEEPTGEHYHTFCWWKIQQKRKEAEDESTDNGKQYRFAGF